MPKMVNSWNEWSPLKRVILGRPEGTCTPAPDPGYWSVDDAGEPALTCGPAAHEKVDAANEQMDHFASVLESRGVIVDRVEIHPSMLHAQPIGTPDRACLCQYGANNPRDTAIVIGPEMCDLCDGDPQCVRFCARGALHFIDSKRDVVERRDKMAEQLAESYREAV